MKSSLIVPVYNPGENWPKWMQLVRQQHNPFLEVILVNSASTDATQFSDLPPRWVVLNISKSEFNHGHTRNVALEFLSPEATIAVFMTQDALLVDSNSIQILLSAFDDPTVACAYGRQLPHTDASPLAAHARFFNYPAASRKVSMADQPELGIKTCFLSNSFAAYRLADLLSVGGFPSDVILGEDMSVAARLLMKGKCVAYVAEAHVKHSHNYTLSQEFHRYFDTGVFHARNTWILKAFGEAGGEGLRFVRSELSFLWRVAPQWIPAALFRTLAKWLGYKLGRQESRLPLALKRWCSMHKGYWS